MYRESYYPTNSIAQGKCKRINNLEFLFIIFFAFYYFFPIVTNAVSMMLALGMCACYICYLMLKKDREGFFAFKLVCFAFIISFLYLVLTETSTISNVANRDIKRLFSKFYQMVFSFLPVIFFLRLTLRASKKQISFLLALVSLLFVCVVINTSVELSINENATRDWSQFEDQASGNVGTYAYIYATTIVIVVLPSLIVSLKNTWAKILTIAIIILLLVFLLFAQYTLSLLIALIGLVLQIFSSIKRKDSKALFIIALFVLIFFLPILFESLSRFVPSPQMAVRLKEVAMFFETGESSSYNLGGRLNLYGKTILAFLESPILGNRNLNFDGHATILTTLADIGLIGGVPLFILFSLSKNQISENMNKRQMKFFLPVFTCLILMGLTNPIHSAPPLSFAVWFLAPLIIKYFINGDEK